MKEITLKKESKYLKKANIYDKGIRIFLEVYNKEKDCLETIESIWFSKKEIFELAEKLKKVTMKKCPFCGAEFKEDGIVYEDGYFKPQKRFWYMCSICQIETRIFNSVKDLKDFWNTRKEE